MLYVCAGRHGNCEGAYAPWGANPSTAVVRDPAGNLYGTTQNGGPGGEALCIGGYSRPYEDVVQLRWRGAGDPQWIGGGVFKLDPQKNALWGAQYWRQAPF
jgi:hypothetical protein